MNEIVFSSTTQLAAEIRVGRISATEVLEAHLQQIGTCNPALVLPYRQDGDGLPLGIQVGGKRWDEARLLALARVLAQVTGEFQRPLAYEKQAK